jgi:hypothetical protein
MDSPALRARTPAIAHHIAPAHEAPGFANVRLTGSDNLLPIADTPYSEQYNAPEYYDQEDDMYADMPSVVDLPLPYAVEEPDDVEPVTYLRISTLVRMNLSFPQKFPP